LKWTQNLERNVSFSFAMRIVITGAGLIGTHTAKELIERGDEVTFFDFAPKPDYIRRVTFLCSNFLSFRLTVA
jgi:nucleoside-diphosphate-sugar epimerase